MAVEIAEVVLGGDAVVAVAAVVVLVVAVADVVVSVVVMSFLVGSSLKAPRGVFFLDKY